MLRHGPWRGLLSMRTCKGLLILSSRRGRRVEGSAIEGGAMTAVAVCANLAP
jgi:hypothetical protein